MSNQIIVLNDVKYIVYTDYEKKIGEVTRLNNHILKLEDMIEKLKSGSNETRFYIHTEPHLFQYKHYSIDAENITEAKEKFFTYLDSTIGEIYPTKSHIDTEKQNTNIYDHPFGDDKYIHIV